MQRFFDIVFSGMALVLFSPLLLPLIFILRVTGEGEIFFLQSRVGRRGEHFMLYKFATMLKDSPNIGTRTVTLANDPRILPMGTFLRHTKINELPQLINILKGHMSIIGPRPLTPETYGAYPEIIRRNLCKVKPGLSGIGPIIFRAEDVILSGNSASMEFYREFIAPYKGLVENWYVANQSIKTYFVCIFVTIWVVVFPRSGLVWRVFKDLPPPPEELKTALNFNKP